MAALMPKFHALRSLDRDGRMLFLTRSVRMFAYGFLSIILGLYLVELGLTKSDIGILVSLTLAGDTVITLWLTTRADRFGRKKTLIAGAALMIFAGVVFALVARMDPHAPGFYPKLFLPLLIAATIGVISPSGNEVGPFLGVEQAALSHVVANEKRTEIFAWYTLFGAAAMSMGTLIAGLLVRFLQVRHIMSALDSYRLVVLAYGAVGILLAILFTRLSPAVEVKKETAPTAAGPTRAFLGLTHSRSVILRLSGLFALDAFGGGFVVTTFTTLWFKARFGDQVNEAQLGAIFWLANLLAALSALLAARVAARFGLINTMVFTHLPSNLLLILVPLMPNLWLATALLWLRFSISQMDVPTRQSYTMAVVRPEERSAAAGVTGVARSVGAMVSPFVAGVLLGVPALIGGIFFLGGGTKIVYDLLLYRSFLKVKPPEEKPA